MGRPQGEGSVYQEADGRWRGAVVVGWTPDATRKGGRRPIVKKVSGTSKRDVRAKMRAVLRDREDGRTLWTGVPTTKAWLEHWLEDIARPTIAPSTYEAYAVVVRRAVGFLGSWRLDEVAPETVESLFAQMRADGKGGSPGNIAVHFRVLRTAFGVAVKRGRIRDNPCSQIDLPKPRKYRPTPLSLDEATRVLDQASAPGSRNGVRWSFALILGWRQGEVLGLTWDHVDLEKGTAIRDRQLARVRGAGLQLRRTKTEASETIVPLPATIIAGLKAVRAQQREDRIAAGTQWDYARLPIDGSEPVLAGLIFTRPHGQAISREDDWAAWHALLKAADVAPRRLHDARHTVGTFMAAAGIHPRVAQELLGHSDVSTTNAIYTTVTSEMAQDAVERMASLLRPDIRSTS